MEKLDSQRHIVTLDIGGTLAKVAFTLPHMSFDKLVGDGYERQPDSQSKRTLCAAIHY